VQTLNANPALAPLVDEGKLEIVGREYLLQSGRAAPV
jgi:hypothetical protein